ncbi:hypothetical protein BJQ90_02925 [Arthrobacter sp. SO3]|nr:hypothetical protein [Arthrobacter sp. SO3]
MIRKRTTLCPVVGQLVPRSGRSPDCLHRAVAAAGGAAGFRCFRVATLVRGQHLKGRSRVMRLSADRTMEGLKRGGSVCRAWRLSAPCRYARESVTSAGRTTLQPRLNFSGRIKSSRAKNRRTLSTRGAAVWGRPLAGRIGSVDSVHTLGPGLGRTGAGLARIPHVSAGAQCLQGPEPGSSPTSGTVFPQVKGLLGGFSCGQRPRSCL